MLAAVTPFKAELLSFAAFTHLFEIVIISCPQWRWRDIVRNDKMQNIDSDYQYNDNMILKYLVFSIITITRSKAKIMAGIITYMGFKIA